MLSTFVLAVLASALGAQESNGENAPNDWWIDKEIVMVGGCVTLVVNKPARITYRCMLRIDGREPIRLVDKAGVTIPPRNSAQPGRDSALVLVSHDLNSPERLQLIEGDPVTYRIVPVFRKPGTLRLTVECDGESLGGRVVTVVPASRDAEPALELLYPTIIRGEGAGRKGAQVMRVLSHPTYGLTPRLTTEELGELRKDLLVVKQHPDWAEIAEMSLARVETWCDLLESQEKLGATPGGVSENTEVPPLPESVTRCLQARVTSPFAKAIQDTIRDIVLRREQLVRSAPQRIDR